MDSGMGKSTNYSGYAWGQCTVPTYRPQLLLMQLQTHSSCN